jgi:hypothetical protein
VRYLSTTLQSIAPSQGSSIQFGIGSASLPSISFIGDTNTGIYSPGADTIAFVEGGVEAMRIDSRANVGIGTSSPTSKLQVLNSTAVDTQIRASNSLSTLTLSSFGDGTSGIETTGAYAQRFFTNSAERARIDSSGNLLVGTTTVTGLVTSSQAATNAPSVAARATSSSFANDVVQIYCARDTNNASYNYILASRPAGVSFVVRDSGNVLNANNSYGSLSDQRIKENIIDATPKLEKLNQVRVVNFNMIGDEQKQLGVVAQELEQIFPGMVEEDRDGMKGVKYSVFVPMLIKAIQEQQAMIDAMKQEIAELKAKVGE